MGSWEASRALLVRMGSENFILNASDFSFNFSWMESYELISFQAQEPDAAVFLSSGSESKVVGKISRRVCLVHYPEPEELEKPGFGALNLSSQRSEGSFRKSMSRYSTTPSKHGSVSRAEGISHNTLASAQSAAKKIRGSSDNNKQKRDEASTAPSEISEKFSGRSSSHASVESQMTKNTALEAEGSTPEKSAKKKRKKIKVEE
uniref:Uncharacterized protein n=1 Tax=Ananas comosus var. bracteatus TaxID=296719 RepID=A0A6V7Q0L4_ANACO|nr:unnamed protein product [Ananas comosus var. bracteatus]